ncbi:MAG: chemotaxis protein CheW [Anaerovoracaceae bacterium]|jgi:two-component system chemotaxis sensor kinase CheA
MSNFNIANDSMLEMYLFESTTLLAQLDEILLLSEQEENLSEDNVNEVFRIMHTIKGSSAMMEFDTVSTVSHRLEDLFYVIRDNGIQDDYFHELFDLVLEVSDFLKDEVEQIRNGIKPSGENQTLIAAIAQLLGKMENSDGSDPSNDSSAPEPAEDKKEEPAASQDDSIYHMHIKFTPDCQMENIRAFMLIGKLEGLGHIITTIPDELNTNPDASSIIAKDGFYCTLVSSASKGEILEQAKGTLSVDTVTFIDELPSPSLIKSDASLSTTSITDTGDTKEPSKETTASAGSADTNADSSGKGQAPKHQNLINVDLNKLDTLMDLVGEIVITESMVSGCAEKVGLDSDSFSRASRQLRKLTDELQDIVMSIRMIPIAGTFQKMRRIVRDMGRKLDKDVELILMGESTEVDKTIIDGIADPLMHLVRNAMDHAIETREERAATSKDPTGRIILSAQNVGGDIFISVSDDGRGLDAEKILEKARDRNLLVKPESEYTEREIFNLLMSPGFSMKESVSEYSGRGVGMDVVKKNIEKVGGTVIIESVKGSGTNILFKIPLTLAIIPSMEVQVGEEIYAIPIANVRESFQASQAQLITDPEGNEMALIRGDCYPIIRMQRIFNIENAETDLMNGILLLVDSGEYLACLFVDQLLGKNQVVVKPFPIYLSNYAEKGSGIAGCTIRGDGSISLILDTQGILNRY